MGLAQNKNKNTRQVLLKPIKTLSDLIGIYQLFDRMSVKKQTMSKFFCGLWITVDEYHIKVLYVCSPHDKLKGYQIQIFSRTYLEFFFLAYRMSVNEAGEATTEHISGAWVTMDDHRRENVLCGQSPGARRLDTGHQICGGTT